MLNIILLSLLSVVASVATANAQEPILQIDTGGHKALINDVIFTPDGDHLVSAGDDNVVRVWDWQAGETVRTIRGHIGYQGEGKIYALALSPDGQWLAVGGWMHDNAIRLYDFKTGNLVTLLKGHEDTLNTLAFSPNSQYLASGGHDATAIIWDVKQQRVLHNLSGHTAEIYAIAFTPDNQRLVTGSYDHDLRLWQVSNGAQLAVLSGHTDKVYTLAVSPQDSLIASGGHDYMVQLWDGKTGELIKELIHQETEIGSLQFTPDGQSLIVTAADSPYHADLFSVPAGEQLLSYQGHDNVVFATDIHPEGRWVATGGGNNNEIHIWDIQTGKLEQRLSGVGASSWAVGFSADGQWLLWGYTSDYSNDNDRGPLEYQLPLPQHSEDMLGAPEPIDRNHAVIQAQTRWRSWSIYAEEGGYYGDYALLTIQNQRKTVAQIERDATDGYGHRSYTFTIDGHQIISGGMNGRLTGYDKAGNHLGNYVGHVGEVWAVAVAPNRSLIASAGDDQTVRLWNTEDQQNIVSVFLGNNGEWVIWTPQGYYAASQNGDNLIVWQINKGIDKNPDYLPAAQLRQHFYRPDIVTAALRLGDAGTAVAEASDTDFTLPQAVEEQPPELTIVTPQPDSYSRFSPIRLEIALQPNPYPVDNISVYVNSTLADMKKFTHTEAFATTVQRKNFDINLEYGANCIVVAAKNAIGTTRNAIIVYLGKRSAAAQTSDSRHQECLGNEP